jgi:hypothetical protein
MAGNYLPVFHFFNLFYLIFRVTRKIEVKHMRDGLRGTSIITATWDANCRSVTAILLFRIA